MNIQVRRKDKKGEIFTSDKYKDEIMKIQIFSYHITVVVCWRDPVDYNLITQTLICQKQDIDLEDYELKNNEEFGEIL